MPVVALGIDEITDVINLAGQFQEHPVVPIEPVDRGQGIKQLHGNLGHEILVVDINPVTHRHVVRRRSNQVADRGVVGVIVQQAVWLG